MFFLLSSLQLGTAPRYIVRMGGNRVQVTFSGVLDGRFADSECFVLNGNLKAKNATLMKGSNVLWVTFPPFSDLSTLSYSPTETCYMTNAYVETDIIPAFNLEAPLALGDADAPYSENSDQKKYTMEGLEKQVLDEINAARKNMGKG